MAKTEKLQKVLAQAGLGSRREIEKWISAKRIKVNGKVATLGDRVSAETAKITIGNNQIHLKPNAINTRVLLYHKPLGVICSRKDPQNRPTIFDNLPSLENGRWIAIGRLDLNTSGLLLFTNNGALANKLMHPSSNVSREYLVRVHGKIAAKTIAALKTGLKLEDGFAKFDSIRPLRQNNTNSWFRVTVSEGRNRLVRRLWNTKKITVNRLIRIRFYVIMLPRSLKKGHFSELGKKDVERLLQKFIGNINKEN